jgi:dynein heavy chain
MSIKITNEAPVGMRAGLRNSYAWVSQDMIDAVGRQEWRQLLFVMCFMHSIVQERRKFGPLGFCVPYEFNQTDLEASAVFMRNHMTEVEMKKGQPSWIAIVYMVCEVQYGGRITDTLDRVLFGTYGSTLLTPKIFDPAFEFSPGYKVMKFGEIPKYQETIETMKDEDHPNVFGMHGNADLTYRTKVTKELLAQVVDIQPKDSGGGDGGPSRDDIVLEAAGKMLKDMPKAFNMIEVRKQIEKLNGGATAQPKPLNIHLKQEVERMQIIIKITRSSLLSLELAIAGTVIMTPDLADAHTCIFDARVPAAWLKKSWVSPTLGLWFGAGLVNRTAELAVWLEEGRPKSFWLTGYFNAQGFLTSVQQEVTRRHNGWSLDDVMLYTEVAAYEKEEAEKRDRLEEGVYCWGLFLEAAAWDKKKNSLVDAPPKKLFCPIPCLFVTAIKRGEKKLGADYSCPCYTVPKRTGQFYVFNANIKTDVPPSTWILRGAALLCSKD